MMVRSGPLTPRYGAGYAPRIPTGPALRQQFRAHTRSAPTRPGPRPTCRYVRSAPPHPKVTPYRCPDPAPTSATSAPATADPADDTQSTYRAPVSEFEEQQEIEAARERNDLESPTSAR